MGTTSLNTAFNHINALDLGGVTTASFISLNAKYMTEEFCSLNINRINDIKVLLGGRKPAAALVDEISNQAPFHLSQLNWTLQQVFGVYNELFAGIPVFLVGDLNQLGPVRAGAGLTDAVMLFLEYQYGLSSSPAAKHDKTNSNSVICHIKEPRRFQPNHPFAKGEDIMMQAQWFELTKQV